MHRHRRQNSDKKWTKVGCYFVLRHQPEELAEVAQVDPKSRAAHILARRAAEEKMLRIRDIDGTLTGTSIERADPRSSLRWYQEDQDLPERLIENGYARPEDFPKRLRSFIRTKDSRE